MAYPCSLAFHILVACLGDGGLGVSVHIIDENASDC
jgi:hypothetical protein